MSDKEAIKTFVKGEYLTVSSGEYSDYCVNGLFRVLKDFDAQDQLEEWSKETGRDLVNGRVESDYSDAIGYMPWLSKNGIIEDINYRELHTDDYGTTVLSEY